jgi:hypothetical protein
MVAVAVAGAGLVVGVALAPLACALAGAVPDVVALAAVGVLLALPGTPCAGAPAAPRLPDSDNCSLRTSAVCGP